MRSVQMAARLFAAYALVIMLAVLAGCSTAPDASPVESANDPRHGATDNFRDIAGPGDGYVVEQGRLRHGQVFRSNALAFTPAELAYVERLGIVTVYDLRTPDEMLAHPDVLPPGATHVEVDVIGEVSGHIAGLTDGSTAPASAAEAVSLAEGIYRDLAGEPHQRRAYGRLLTAVANAAGPVIIHCTAGKDRTGWAAALLLSIAGASRSDVFRNYLLSNEYSAQSIATATEQARRSHGQAAAEAVEPLLGVRASYLAAAFDVVDREFGGVDRYLAAGLDLAPATLAALRAKLVVATN